MQPIIGIDNTGDIVPTGLVAPPQHPQQHAQQQQIMGQVPGGGNGIQIPTSMQQMKGQATTLLKKISPAPPAPPPQGPASGKIQSGPMQLSGQGDAHDTDVVIGGKQNE